MGPAYTQTWRFNPRSHTGSDLPRSTSPTDRIITFQSTLPHGERHDQQPGAEPRQLHPGLIDAAIAGIQPLPDGEPGLLMKYFERFYPDDPQAAMAKFLAQRGPSSVDQEGIQ